MFNKILLIPENDSIDQPSIRRLSLLANDSTEVELFSPVHEPHLDAYLGNTGVYESLRQRIVEERSEAQKALVSQLGSRFRVTPKVKWDWPLDDAIATEAVAFGADLVIVNPGRDGRRFMGSTDWRLVAHCPVPILMVRSAASEPYGHIVAAVDPVHAHAKPADLDEVIVDCANGVQALTKAQLSLLHCYLPLSHFKPDEGSQIPLNDAEKALEESRQLGLNKLAAAAGLSPSATLLREGKPQAVLESMIANGEADLIVMGGLSRGRIADFLIGSTAEHMLQHSECDLLIVKPRA